MLDLDKLAEKRALSLNQSVEDWQGAVWSQEFQKLSQSMSDGEVEEILSFCANEAELKAVAIYLLERTGQESPFNFLLSECEKAGVKPSEWIRNQLANGKDK